MAQLRVMKEDLKRVNSIVKKRGRGSPIIHTQASVIHDALNALEKLEKKQGK